MKRKVTIKFTEEDIKKMLKKYFGIKGNITSWWISSMFRNQEHYVEFEEDIK